jgi:hypothetical protein
MTLIDSAPGARLLATWLAGILVVGPVMLGPASARAQQQTDTDEAAESPPPNKRGSQTPSLAVLPAQAIGSSIQELVPRRIGEMVRDRVAEEGGIDTLPSFAVMQRREATRSQSTAAIEEARKQYTSGIGLLEAGEYQRAADTLQQAVDRLRANVADLQNFDVLADAMARLAWAYFEAGYDFDARSYIKEFAHLRPEATLDFEDFPAELKDIFEQEVRKVENAGTSTLTVEADEKGASVWIDGVKEGTTPLTVEVGFGAHYLVVKGATGRWTSQILVRGRGTRETYEASLSRPQRAEVDERPAYFTQLLSGIADGIFGAELGPELDEFTDQSGADDVAWVTMQKIEGQFRAIPFVYSADEDLYLQGDPVTFDLELSNLRLGVDDLGEQIIDMTLNTPADRAFEKVDLTSKPEANAEADAAPDDETGAQQESEAPDEVPRREKAETDEQPDTQQESVQPPPPIEEDEEKGQAGKWILVGIGSAAATAGLVVGGVLLFGENKPDGFQTEVSW